MCEIQTGMLRQIAEDCGRPAATRAAGIGRVYALEGVFLGCVWRAVDAVHGARTGFCAKRAWVNLGGRQR